MFDLVMKSIVLIMLSELVIFLTGLFVCMTIEWFTSRRKDIYVLNTNGKWSLLKGRILRQT